MTKGVTVLVAGLSVVSCAQDTSRPTGPSFEVRIAALELPGVVDACYTLAVYNEPITALAATALVWTEAGLCAQRYGDERGSITYVGTCDASPDGRINTVSLVLEGLCSGEGCDPGDDDDPETIDSDTYVNPCPVGRPCLIERPCDANADTLVKFDLTVMRDAGQGFFDIGVTFDNIFCSAKLDCVDRFLHRPDGPRDLTAILAFACTSGRATTCLYATDVELDCGGANVWTIDPSLGPGLIAESSPLLYAAATYQGDEAFTTFDKSYWNVALGLDASLFSTYPNCTLRWTTTASESGLDGDGPYTTPVETSYPLLEWERDILVGGALACESHPLDVVLPDEALASVRTGYSATTTPTELAHSNCDTTPPLCQPGDPDADADGVPDACDTCPDGETFTWVSWDNIEGTTATGTVGTVGVTYTSSAPVASTQDVYSHGTFPGGYAVPNTDPTIQNTAVTSNTLTFAQPVTNPTFVFASIGNTINNTVVPIVFDTPVRLLFCVGLLDGPDWQTAQPVVCNGQTVTTIYGYEGYAILEVPGTHTSIGFDYTVAEFYANFVFGTNTCDGGSGGGDENLIDNGGFELGDFTGWSQALGTSTSSVVTSRGTILPSEGEHMALIEHGGGSPVFLTTVELEWTSVAQVCFDIAVLLTDDAEGDWSFEVIAHPTAGQPIVAAGQGFGPSEYEFAQIYPLVTSFNELTGSGDATYTRWTGWLSACADTSDVEYNLGDTSVALQFKLRRDMGGATVAYLIDNVRTIPSE